MLRRNTLGSYVLALQFSARNVFFPIKMLVFVCSVIKNLLCHGVLPTRYGTPSPLSPWLSLSLTHSLTLSLSLTLTLSLSLYLSHSLSFLSCLSFDFFFLVEHDEVFSKQLFAFLSFHLRSILFPDDLWREQKSMLRFSLWMIWNGTAPFLKPCL